MRKLPDGAGCSANDDRVLLARIVARDREAFERLYRTTYARLSSFLSRTLRSPQTVEEVLNDTMFIVWDKAHTFAGNSRVSTWIFGIAYRQALKRLEREGRRPEGHLTQMELAEMPAPDNIERNREFDDWLHHALECLSPQHRLVVEAVFYLGLTYEEISRIAQCPVGTVKTRMFHARRKLKRILPSIADAGRGGPTAGHPISSRPDSE